MTAPTINEQDKAQIKRILNIQVPVIAVIGETQMLLADVLKLAPGTVIEIGKGSREPLDLMVGDRQIGSGKAIRKGEYFGVQVTEIGGPEETIRRLTLRNPNF